MNDSLLVKIPFLDAEVEIGVIQENDNMIVQFRFFFFTEKFTFLKIIWYNLKRNITKITNKNTLT